MNQNEQLGHLEDSPGNDTVDGRHESNRISRRKALKRIGLAFGSLSLLGLLPIAGPDRLNANLNAMDDPEPQVEGQTSSSSKHRTKVPKICSSCVASTGTMAYFDSGSAYSSDGHAGSSQHAGASSVGVTGGSYGGSVGSS